MSFLRIRHLWKKYDAKTVLEDVDLVIDSEEFVTIVGASGCGKTTFLRILLGEEMATSGSVELNGKPLVGEPGADRGVVFQRYSVFPHLTAVENVALGLDIAGAPILGRTFGKERRANLVKAEGMLERVGLAGARDAYPDQLSGGMQQRLALAQTLIAEPSVLLLDEPFGALDPGIRSDMHDLVSELHCDLKLTVFMITHDISEGFKLGTRLLVFDKRRVDPHEPDLYGASVTFDLEVGRESQAPAINFNYQGERSYA